MNESRTLTLSMHLVEGEHTTTADVSMTTPGGQEVTGHGTARRHPRDPDVPQVGDELAAARALSELAHRLLDTAAHDLSERLHKKVELTS
jgi:hypothetical protein